MMAHPRKPRAIICSVCGTNTEERSALLIIAARASDLIHEGRKEDNLEGVVFATDALITELRNFNIRFAEVYGEVQ